MSDPPNLKAASLVRICKGQCFPDGMETETKEFPEAGSDSVSGTCLSIRGWGHYVQNVVKGVICIKEIESKTKRSFKGN